MESLDSLHFDKLNSLSKDIFLEGSYLDKDHKDLLIRCRGYIDSFNSAEFGKSIARTIDMISPEYIVIDLESVNYVASLGIGQLVSIYKMCLDKNLKLRLFNVNPKVYEVLQLLGFSSFFVFIEEIKDYKIEKKLIFPKSIKCPVCYVTLKIPKPGSFKCSGCKDIIIIDEKGEIIIET